MPGFSFDLSRFTDDDACWKFLEAAQWPKGPVCPNCDSVGDATPWKPRPHYWQCFYKGCGKQFHAAYGTPMEGTHLPMRKWFEAIYLHAIAPKISTVELGHRLNVGQKTAWLMAKRLHQNGFLDSELARSIVAVIERQRPTAATRKNAGKHS
jgi:hypothetical protein